MPYSVQKHESGSALRIIGWVMMLFAFLVMFFNPAAVKLGESRFATIAASLAGGGVLLSLIGTYMRRSNR